MSTQEIAKWLDNVIEQLHQVRDLAVSLDTRPKLPDEAIERIEKGLCPKCGEPFLEGEKKHRGVHARCYKDVNRWINEGIITDRQAVSRGYYLPVTNKGGRKPSKDHPTVKAQQSKPKRPTSKKKQA